VAEPTTTGGADLSDQRSHIERINQFSNPADGTGLDVVHTADSIGGVLKTQLRKLMEGLHAMNDEQIERALSAMESIAGSLVKMANPLIEHEPSTPVDDPQPEDPKHEDPHQHDDPEHEDPQPDATHDQTLLG
jgi:hypothetical protein